MTDTAKPTRKYLADTFSSPMRLMRQQIDGQGGEFEILSIASDLSPRKKVAYAHMFEQAANIRAETGLTPRQLLERVRELEAEQAELVQFFTELANDSVVFGLDTEFGDGFSVGVKTVCDAIKAAIGKHGEKV